jgi:hypothetical protein
MRARLCLLALFLLACDDLPAAQDGTCGNKVVDSTEDCDTFATQPGTRCVAPGSPNQCRYACGFQQDTKTTATCPSGMGCGADGTCRASTGTFVAAGQSIGGTFADIAIGDIDGDHRDDVVGLGPLDFSTTFFDAKLSSATTVHLARNASSLVHPMLRDITGDGRADLVSGFGSGTLVNLGSASRAFVPTACPSSYIQTLTNARMITLGALPPSTGDTLFMMGTYLGLSAIVVLQNGGQGAVFTFLDTPPDDLAGDVVVGHMVENPALSPCDELAFGRVDATHVDVYTACVPDGSGGFMYNTYSASSPPRSINLPTGATLVRGPMLIDVNGDGHLDFLVGASRCSGCDEVDVAYGVGDGTFHSDPLAIPKTAGDDAFSKYPLVSGPLPLAMGDVNGDGVLDQVTPTAVLVSHVSGSVVTFAPQAKNHGDDWTEAVVADFNHDGMLDVAAGSSASPNLSFFNGNGDGTFAPFTIPSGAVKFFTVGDFDGDHVNDLALDEVASTSDTLGDSLSILFGNAAGAPNAPASMGRFVDIRHVIAGRFNDAFGVLPSTKGVLTTSTPDATTTAFGSFMGQGNRVLRSPANLTIPTGSTSLASAIPHRYALGHFVSATAPFDLAVIDDQIFPARFTPTHRVWILPTDGNGGFDDAHAYVVYAPLSDSVDWSRANIAAIDLDGTGVDQLVALGPSSDTTKGAVSVARYDPGIGMVFDQPAFVDAVVDREESNTTNAQTGRLLAQDIDGDGNPDLLALASVGGVPSVVVFWNDHEGRLDAMTAIPNPNGHAAVDFAVLDAGGGGLTVAVLNSDGISLVSFAQRTPNAPTLAFAAPNAHLVAAGDVNGDGVTDLVVADDVAFSVFQGQPVRP